MPSSGAFVCSDFVVLGVLRRKIVVPTKHCKLQESIRFPSFVRRLESRLRTPDSRPVMASEPQSPTCAPCYGEISACSAGARAAGQPPIFAQPIVINWTFMQEPVRRPLI